MFQSISLFRCPSHIIESWPAFLNFSSSELTNRIKEIATAIFSKATNLFKSFQNQSSEINIKAVAMISCVSLIVVLVRGFLRRREAGMST